MVVLQVRRRRQMRRKSRSTSLQQSSTVAVLPVSLTSWVKERLSISLKRWLEITLLNWWLVMAVKLTKEKLTFKLKWHLPQMRLWVRLPPPSPPLPSPSPSSSLLSSLTHSLITPPHREGNWSEISFTRTTCGYSQHYWSYVAITTRHTYCVYHSSTVHFSAEVVSYSRYIYHETPLPPSHPPLPPSLYLLMLTPILYSLQRGLLVLIMLVWHQLNVLPRFLQISRLLIISTAVVC